MAYDSKKWHERSFLRTDMSLSLVHLTRPITINRTEYSPVDILLKILKEQKLIGSTNYPGYIIGSTRAVCFQETSLISVAQSLYYEKRERDRGYSKEVRYSGVGLSFYKRYIYQKGGRPVFYEKTENRNILQPSEWWRLVDFNHENEKDITDWTHEREWRVPNDFTFKREHASIIVQGRNDYQELISKCHPYECDILKEIRGIVTLNDIFM